MRKNINKMTQAFPLKTNCLLMFLSYIACSQKNYFQTLQPKQDFNGFLNKRNHTKIKKYEPNLECVKRFTLKEAKELTPEMIKKLEKREVIGLSIHQIENFTSNQFMAFLPHQIKFFLPTQIKRFLRRQIMVLSNLSLYVLLKERFFDLSSKQKKWILDFIKTGIKKKEKEKKGQTNMTFDEEKKDFFHLKNKEPYSLNLEQQGSYLLNSEQQNSHLFDSEQQEFPFNSEQKDPYLFNSKQQELFVLDSGKLLSFDSKKPFIDDLEKDSFLDPENKCFLLEYIIN